MHLAAKILRRSLKGAHAQHFSNTYLDVSVPPVHELTGFQHFERTPAAGCADGRGDDEPIEPSTVSEGNRHVDESAPGNRRVNVLLVEFQPGGTKTIEQHAIRRLKERPLHNRLNSVVKRGCIHST